MVVRGYDREQVDAWVQNPIGKPEFTVVLRGYDRHQVDSFVAQVARGAWPAEPGPVVPELTRVLRGYDTGQVDLLIDQINASLNGAGGVSSADVERAEFKTRLTGYDRAQVDAFLQWAVTELRGLGR